jgi:hypothetical protein
VVMWTWVWVAGVNLLNNVPLITLENMVFSENQGRASKEDMTRLGTYSKYIKEMLT